MNMDECVFPSEISCVFIGFIGPVRFVLKTDHIKKISNNMNKYNNLSYI